MFAVVFLLGFSCGLVAMGLWQHFRQGFTPLLGDDEKYLLAAARAANGRLILKEDRGMSGTPILLLKEFPNPRRIEDKGLLEKLVGRRLIQVDGSGAAGRYLLTARGWTCSQKLPEFPLQPIRPGSWFNSISRKPQRIVRR